MRETGAVSHAGPGDRNPALRGHQKGNGWPRCRARRSTPTSCPPRTYRVRVRAEIGEAKYGWMVPPGRCRCRGRSWWRRAGNSRRCGRCSRCSSTWSTNSQPGIPGEQAVPAAHFSLVSFSCAYAQLRLSSEKDAGRAGGDAQAILTHLDQADDRHVDGGTDGAQVVEPLGPGWPRRPRSPPTPPPGSWSAGPASAHAGTPGRTPPAARRSPRSHRSCRSSRWSRGWRSAVWCQLAWTSRRFARSSKCAAGWIRRWHPRWSSG